MVPAMSTTPPDQPASPAAADKRSEPRRRVVKGAKIAFGDFVFVRDCTVRDLSSRGARISTSGTHEVPDEFPLVFTADRLMRRARARWRTDREIGVMFEGDPVSLMANPDPRLRQFQFV